MELIVMLLGAIFASLIGIEVELELSRKGKRGSNRTYFEP